MLDVCPAYTDKNAWTTTLLADGGVNDQTCIPCDAVCTVLVIVILSVRPSVCHTRGLVRPTIMISSPQGSPIILVSGDITFIPKFEGGHPERGR